MTHRLARVFEQRRAVCLWGDAGSGKTGLCTEFCCHFSAPGGRRFSAGAFLVDFRRAVESSGDFTNVFSRSVLAELQQRRCAMVEGLAGATVGPPQPPRWLLRSV